MMQRCAFKRDLTKSSGDKVISKRNSKIWKDLCVVLIGILTYTCNPQHVGGSSA